MELTSIKANKKVYWVRKGKRIAATVVRTSPTGNVEIDLDGGLAAIEKGRSPSERYMTWVKPSALVGR